MLSQYASPIQEGAETLQVDVVLKSDAAGSRHRYTKLVHSCPSDATQVDGQQSPPSQEHKAEF